MKGPVGVLDYGMGNLRSVEKALIHSGAKAFVSDDPHALSQAALLVVPGVGAFDAAMTVLRKKKLDRFIQDWVNKDRPYLGICLGLQLLFESSEEAPGKKGLGVLKGKVVKFRLADRRLKVPHMGWNEVHPKKNAAGCWKKVLTRKDYFYFVHSYLARPTDPALVWTNTPYAGEFCSAVARGNLLATQFHPEKSGPTGLRFLREVLKSVSLNPR
ncbi:MAG: imidazole glycerol phosphate synthase subunit HisH [Elusimicrobia bacterium]|jgi:glutamine amidotransferase|nr:imidazole glycerol phosphate synthase subunit HisH [Elusimicrobiota bacterium]